MKILDNNKNFSRVSKSNNKQIFFIRQYGNTCIQKTKFAYSKNGSVMRFSGNWKKSGKLTIPCLMMRMYSLNKNDFLIRFI